MSAGHVCSPIRCDPSGFAFRRHGPMNDEMNRIFVDLIEGGFDQFFSYKFVPFISTMGKTFLQDFMGKIIWQ